MENALMRRNIIRRVRSCRVIRALRARQKALRCRLTRQGKRYLKLGELLDGNLFSHSVEEYNRGNDFCFVLSRNYAFSLLFQLDRHDDEEEINFHSTSRREEKSTDDEQRNA